MIRKDDIHDPVSKYIPEHLNRSKASFDVLYKILESNKHSDVTFVLDFSFQSKVDYSIIKTWCDERRIDLKSILVTCSDEKVWAERFNKRANNPLPNQVITNFDDLKEHYVDLQILPEDGELLVDTVNTVEVIVEKLLKIIT